jgi:cytoskeletal protein RodZ
VSFGAELQQERLKRDVSLESISDSTKVAMRYLRALEEDTMKKSG